MIVNIVFWQSHKPIKTYWERENRYALAYPLPTSFLTLLEGKQNKGCRDGHSGSVALHGMEEILKEYASKVPGKGSKTVKAEAISIIRDIFLKIFILMILIIVVQLP